jgi:hypothetical protein
MALLPFLICLLQGFLKLLDFLGQLCKVLVLGITFLSTFLRGAEIGLLLSVLLNPTTITSVVHGIHAPMLLVQVAICLKTDFLGNPGCRIVPGCFFPFLYLLEDFSEDSGLPFS